jgi:hypothetical protein
MLSKRNCNLTVPAPNIEDRGAFTIEEFKEGALLSVEHPRADGIPETRRILI